MEKQKPNKGKNEGFQKYSADKPKPKTPKSDTQSPPPPKKKK
jgi:hypothetical protein